MAMQMTFKNLAMYHLDRRDQKGSLPALPAFSELKLFDLPSFKFRVVVRKKYSVFFC